MMARPWHPFEVVARVFAERLHGHEPPAALRAELSSREIDWEGVVRLASDQYVLPALAAAVRELDLVGALEPELRAFLAAVHAANLERNRQLRDQLAEVVAALNRGGVEPVLLKGAIRLVEGLYPDRGWRMMRDLDVLVPDASFETAVETLRRAGYTPDRSRIASPRAAAERVHFPGLRHPARPAPVELHRRLFLRSRRLLQAVEVFDGSRRARSEDMAARVPSNEHQAAHLIGHCQISDHGYALGRIELRDLLEAAALARWAAGGVDWDMLAARFDRAGYRRPFLTFLLSLRDLAFCPVPEPKQTDPLTAFQRRRVWHRARSATSPGAGYASWLMILLKNFVLEGETRRHILALPVKEIGWRLYHRGPRAR